MTDVGVPPRIRVLVVDDDPGFVAATVGVLGADDRLEVVGGATNGAEALEQAAALHPNVVAMDVSMPIMDGVEATKALCERLPDCRVVLVSGSIFVDEEAAATARAAGAAAYVTKSRAMVDLADVIAAVGEVFSATSSG